MTEEEKPSGDGVNPPTDQSYRVQARVEVERERSFVDRHFSAVLSACAVILAASIGAGVNVWLSDDGQLPELSVVTARPSVGKPVKFRIDEAPGVQYRITVARVEGDSDTREATKGPGGIFYEWQPTAAGIHWAKLEVVGREDSTSAGRQFEVYSDKTDPVIDAKDPPVFSQRFQHRIGDGSSCTERNVQRTFDLCLPEPYSVIDWSVSPQSVRNGAGDVARHPSLANCVVLTLRYSDSGRGVFGDCRGNGWADYAVTVNGRRSD
jgi:hypothetical protein